MNRYIGKLLVVAYCFFGFMPQLLASDFMQGFGGLMDSVSKGKINALKGSKSGLSSLNNSELLPV